MEDLHKTFGVYAYAYDKNQTWETAELYANDNVTLNGDVWTYNPVRFWPGEDYKMKFFAYAPTSMNPTITDDKQLSVSHKVKLDVTKQEDLLLAIHDNVNGNTNSTFNLQFEHILTAVKVKVAAGMKGTIKSISFKNIKSEGSHTFSEEEEIWGTISSGEHSTCKNEVWGSSSEPESFDLDIDDGQLDGSEVMIADGEHTFMMIPQTLGADAELVVTFDNGTPEGLKLKGKLAGKVWPIGHTVTYIISNTGIKWEFNVPKEIVLDYSGQLISQFRVQSYVESTNSERSPVPWRADFIVDKPEWVTDFPQSGDGSVDFQNYSAKARQQIIQNESTAWLRDPQRGYKKGESSSPYNLSNSTGGANVENTANCYIVNGPGTYSLPLVYGNAIKDGEKNESSYKRFSSGQILSTFINHAGASISDPWITKNGCQPDAAKIIWQDAQDLVTNIKLEGNFIIFDVESEYIQQGNAIIAVLQGSTVLWSWHIWVTNYEPLGEIGHDDYNRGNMPAQLMKDREVETADGQRKYTFMGPLLGWCYKGAYPERYVEVLFTQESTGMTEKVKVIQKYFWIDNHAPTYQWGRKDPILPGNGIHVGGTKYYYDSNGECSKDFIMENWNTGNENIKKGIQNPGKFGFNYRMDNCYVNLWNNNSYNIDREYVTSNTCKTIYDPSPIGYTVPSNDATSGFTYNGNDINGEWDEMDNPFNLNNCNTPYQNVNSELSENDGWVFFCKRMNNVGLYSDDKEVIYFPKMISRMHVNNDVSLSDWGVLYWTALSHPITSPGNDYSSALVISLQEKYFWRIGLGYNRGHGLAVRPVREK